MHCAQSLVSNLSARQKYRCVRGMYEHHCTAIPFRSGRADTLPGPGGPERIRARVGRKTKPGRLLRACVFNRSTTETGSLQFWYLLASGTAVQSRRISRRPDEVPPHGAAVCRRCCFTDSFGYIGHVTDRSPRANTSPITGTLPRSRSGSVGRSGRPARLLIRLRAPGARCDGTSQVARRAWRRAFFAYHGAAVCVPKFVSHSDRRTHRAQPVMSRASPRQRP
jgi:hypothetical protein